MASEEDDKGHHDEHPMKRIRRKSSRWEQEEEVNNSIPFPAVKRVKLNEIVQKLTTVVQTASSFPSDPHTLSQAAQARVAQSLSLPILSIDSIQEIARRVYIGNLYYALKESDIKSYFIPFGTIRSIDLAMEPGCGRSKGFCFIEYEDVLAAESAVQVLNDTSFGNRQIKVGRPRRGHVSDATIGKEAIKIVPTNCIYVGNVRIELHSHQIATMFSPFGEIQKCVMTALELDPTRHRGYGFIQFSTVQAAENAIQHMNGFELAGQSIKVGKASPSALVINVATSTDQILHFQPIESISSRKRITGDDEEVDAVEDGPKSSLKLCLCLLNMVQLGEIDLELKEEVKEECNRFGQVTSVEIHEVEDHVRIFVVFKSEEDALQAKNGLHGRYFGGKQIQVEYYSTIELVNRRYQSPFL